VLVVLTAAMFLVAGTTALREPARAASGCATPGQITSTGAWTTIRPPVFPDSSSEQSVTAYAVDRTNAGHLLVTNGTSVMRSNDGGCTWTNTFTAPTTTFGGVKNVVGGNGVTVQLAVTRLVIAGANNAYLLLDGQSEGSHALQVQYSTDGGSTWSASAGLPTTGEATAFAESETRNTIAYVSITGGALYWTTNGGETWSKQSTLPTDPVGMTVNESAEKDLFAWSKNVLYRSGDGGVTFGAFSVKTGIAAADVSATPFHGLLITLFLDDLSVVQSEDGGRTWLPLSQTATNVTSAVHGFHVPSHLIAVTQNNVLSAIGESEWTDVSPSDSKHFADAQATRTDIVFVRSDEGLERTELSSVEPTERNSGLRIPPAFLGPPSRPGITPGGAVVNVAPGSTVTVNYTLAVPHHFSPVDIYFLVDTTGSVNSTITAMQASIRSIVAGLTLAKVDAHLGLGELKDYPMLEYGSPGDVPYTRLRDLGPPDSQLIAAVNALQANGGGDNPEAQLPALYQSATGAGQPAPATPTYIAPGQQANFRPGVERVIMLATDAAFHRSDTDPTYPGSSFTATVAALRQHDIKVVGLSLGENSMHDLKAMALATGAIATTDVDCNGEGHRDVVVGAPMVCPIDPDGTHLAAGVLNALGAVLPGGVVVPTASGAGGVVRSIDPPTFGSISLGIDHALSFAVTYGCNPAQRGQRYPVSLRGSLDGSVLATASATVACALPAQPVLIAAAPTAHPPIARSPTPQIQAPSLPPPAPEAQFSPQVNAQLQVAASHQDQEQPQFQVATVGPQTGADGDVQLAFSTPRRPSEQIPYPLDGAACVAAAAGAGWLRSKRRTQTRPAFARARIGTNSRGR
jgi:hypothetical protein